MRKIYLLFLVVLFSCKKDGSTTTTKSGNDPSIVSCTWTSIPEAGGQHPKFTVNITCDSTQYSNLKLFMSPSLLRWDVKGPQTGTYIMYDHVAEFPTGSEVRYYYFVFYKKDGSTISLTPFHVY